MVQILTEGMTERDLEGGSNKPVPGLYHVFVEEAFENEEEGFASLKFQVVAGTIGDEVGKSITERFYFAGGDEKKTATCMRRLARLAVAIGLMGRKQVGSGVAVDFAQAEGRQCVIKVIECEYTDKGGKQKKTTNVDFFGFWSSVDPDVQQVPKDADMLKLPTGEAFGVAHEPAAAPKSDGNPSPKAAADFSDL